MGQFPATMLATMRAAANRGQRTVPEMIDGHQVRDPQVRDLLTGYVARRSADLDYPSAEALAYRLAGLFWTAIEKINPGQADLRLSETTYQQWKAGVSVLPGGQPRQHLAGSVPSRQDSVRRIGCRGAWRFLAPPWRAAPGTPSG